MLYKIIMLVGILLVFFVRLEKQFVLRCVSVKYAMLSRKTKNKDFVLRHIYTVLCVKPKRAFCIIASLPSQPY